MRRDNPIREIEIGQQEMDEVGFLRPGQSLRKILFSDMSAQVAGVYDFKTKTLYVRGQDNQAFHLERYVIVHEYTHALQDQHWHLAKILPDEYKIRYRNSDALSARHALVEGDAVNTQGLYIERSYTPAEVRGMITYEQHLPTGVPLPRAIQKQFYFPYTTGVRFAQTLYQSGGMRAINAAFTRLPSSTYEIMFPDAYLRHWRAADVQLHGVRGFGRWKRVDDDVFGALGYKMLLWQHSSESAATSALRSYRGDRYVFLEKGSAGALLMESKWQSGTAARRAAQKLASSIEKRFGRTGAWRPDHPVVRGEGVSAYVRSRGANVTLAYAPTSSLALRLGKARTF
jgi:hypothetical protein